jgi:predicted nucleic acid-binding protein
MKALLDTCVLAEIRSPQGRAEVKAAIERFADNDLFVSVLTVFASRRSGRTRAQCVRAGGSLKQRDRQR